MSKIKVTHKRHLSRLLLAALMVLAGTAAAFALTGRAAPPCWSNSPHRVCPPSTTTQTTTTVPTTTTTATTTTATTTPTTTSSTPPADVLFNGSASLMSVLYSYESTPGDLSTLHQGQSPALWSCLCFVNDDLSLYGDTTFGKVFKATVPVGDHNPWNSGAPSDSAAAQLSIVRPNDLGKWDWFAFAVKIPSTWGCPSWADILSLGYQTIQGDQEGIDVVCPNGVPSFEIQGNDGKLTLSSSGWYDGSHEYRQVLMAAPLDQYVEFVVGIKWATDNTGAVEVYTRPVGGSWTHRWESLNVPTYAYGTTTYKTVYSDLSNEPNVMDKLGLYYTSSSLPAQTDYISGLTRTATMASAQSMLP